MRKEEVRGGGEPGSVIAATVAPATLLQLDPVLRHLLAGTQDFVRQPDGRYRPRGCAMGLARCFALSELIPAP